MRLGLLDSGSCEAFKGCVHGGALGLVVLMGLYNAAAWLRRRERHLAINTVLYGAATIWEYQHVKRHCKAAVRESARASDREDPWEPPFAA
jgi:hypothetical protein